MFVVQTFGIYTHIRLVPVASKNLIFIIYINLQNDIIYEIVFSFIFACNLNIIYNLHHKTVITSNLAFEYPYSNSFPWQLRQKHEIPNTKTVMNDFAPQVAYIMFGILKFTKVKRRQTFYNI